MKQFLVTLLAIGCIGILIAGNLHWKEKTFVAAEKGKQEVIFESEKPKVENHAYMKKTENWPPQARETYQFALEEGNSFKILIAGSSALGSDETAWSHLIKKELEQTYGETVQVIVKSYDLTSEQFIAEDKLAEFIAVQPDVTLLEPFTLMDNGKVMISQSHQHIGKIAAGLKQQNPEHVFMLQPPNPLYAANYYPVQVDALQKYAEKQGIPFLHHWTAWPNPKDKEIMNYLTAVDSNTVPSEKGHQVWAEFLTDYFITD